MSVLIAATIFLGSFLGITTMLFRKAPLLLELPEEKNIARERLFSRFKKKIKSISFFKSVRFEILLQKMLSKIRILTLKMENKTGFWLQKLRERSLQKKIKENDNYWEKVKKIKTKPR